jgi:hypothetical protein
MNHFSKIWYLSCILSDVKKNLVKSFNESYSEQKCSISQRQGIITCIPKKENLNTPYKTRAVSIIYNTAADIIIKGFDPRTKRLPKTKKL